ncbi:MAG: GldG family protein [Planctomycetota bacterium]|nr:GldG family protein [Planctomycetota bacterium]
MIEERGSRRMLLLTAGLLLTGILVVANVLASRFFLREDITAEKRYSLSEPAVRILKRLKDKVVVKYYVSNTESPALQQLKRETIDRLIEFQMASDGNFEFEVIDPEPDPDLQKTLKDRDIVPVTWPLPTKSGVEFANGYSAMTVNYLDKKVDPIQPYMDLSRLEYDLLRRVLAVTQDEKPVVAMYAPRPDIPPHMMNPMMMPQDEFAGLPDAFKENFDVRRIDLKEGSSIPKETKCLLILKPKELKPRQRYEVTKYIAEGGNAILCLPRYSIGSRMFFGPLAEEIKTGLEEDLESWGVRIDPEVVCDASYRRSAVAFMSAGKVQIAQPPTAIMVSGSNLNQDSFITMRMSDVPLPWSAPIRIDEAKAKAAGLTITPLARSHAATWLLHLPLEADGLRKIPSKKEELKPQQILACYIEDKFPFAFNDKPAPKWEKDKDSHSPDEDKDKEKDKDKKDDVEGPPTKIQSKEGRVVLFSTADHLNLTNLQVDRLGIFGSPYERAMYMVYNALEGFTLGDDLIKIRAKHYEERALKPLEPNEEIIWQAVLVGAVPLAVAAFGLIRWLIRRQARVLYEKRFAGGGTGRLAGTEPAKGGGQA